MKATPVLVFIILMTICSSALAESDAVPLEINYQGRLIDAGGSGIDGMRKFQFNIYTVPTGGASVWGPLEVDNVTVIDGHYNVVLRGLQGNPIAGVFSKGMCYLGIKVTAAGASFDGVSEISPRKQFLSAPYAMTARNAIDTPGRRDRNLRIMNSPSSPDDKISISFDYLTLYDNRGFIRVKSVSSDSPEIVDITQAGPGGLDAGVELPSTWYYIWVVYNPQTDSVKGFFSLSHESPVLPAGYTAKRLAGAVYNKEDGNFRKINQLDKWVATEFIEFNVPASSEFQEMDLSSLIPYTAKMFFGTAGGHEHYFQGFASEPYPLQDETNTPYGLGYLQQGGTCGQIHYFPISMAVIRPQKIINRRVYQAEDTVHRHITVTGWKY